MKWMRARGRDGEEQGLRWICIDFVLLTRGTTLNVAPHKGSKAGPPELRGDELTGFEDARVTHCGMIMMVGNNGIMKIGIHRDINAPLKSQDTCIIVPVGEL